MADMDAGLYMMVPSGEKAIPKSCEEPEDGMPRKGSEETVEGKAEPREECWALRSESEPLDHWERESNGC